MFAYVVWKNVICDTLSFFPAPTGLNKYVFFTLVRFFLVPIGLENVVFDLFFSSVGWHGKGYFLKLFHFSSTGRPGKGGALGPEGVWARHGGPGAFGPQGWFLGENR